jgi:hypothetical protein
VNFFVVNLDAPLALGHGQEATLALALRDAGTRMLVAAGQITEQLARGYAAHGQTMGEARRALGVAALAMETYECSLEEVMLARRVFEDAALGSFAPFFRQTGDDYNEEA